MPSVSRRIKGRDRLVVLASGSEVTSQSGTAVYSAAAVASKLAIITQPAGATDALAFTTQPVVELQTAGSVAVPQAGVTVTASIVVGAGTLVGTATAVTAGDGRATFTNLGIDASSPPASFTVRFSATGLTAVDSSSLTVSAGGSLPTLVGHWDWSTGTGWTDAVGRDTNKTVALTLFNGGNGGVDIASVAGKGFPTGIVNGVRNNRSSGSNFDWVGAQDVWAAPSVGQTLYGRIYFRNEIVSTANLDYGACHPFESYGANSGGYNFDGNGGYSFKLGNNTDGTTFGFVFATYGTGTQYYWGYNVTTPANSATNPALLKNHTYRFEWALTRTTGNTYTLQLRLYNESGTLIASGTDWKDNYNGGGVALNSSRTTTMIDTSIRGMRVGTNGGWGVGSAQYVYWSGLAVSLTDWCGPYDSVNG